MIKIYHIIIIILVWIKKLGYLDNLSKLIRLYHFIILKFDKNFTAFYIASNKNIKYLIFITTNVYSIGINNSDVRLII